MQARCVQVHVIVLYVGVARGYFGTAVEEEAIGATHDVGFVHGSDCLSTS